jgi:hypothetical protein
MVFDPCTVWCENMWNTLNARGLGIELANIRWMERLEKCRAEEQARKKAKKPIKVEIYGAGVTGTVVDRDKDKTGQCK